MKKRMAAVAAGLVASALGVLTTAGIASAHHNTVDGSSQCKTSTSTYDIVWTITNSENNKSETASWSVPNGTPASGSVAIGPSGSATVKTYGHTGNDLTITVDGQWTGATSKATKKVSIPTKPCTKKTPNVGFTDPTCAARQAKTVITAVTGVEYRKGDTTVAGTINEVSPSSVVVDAYPLAGFELNSPKKFQHTFPTVNDSTCKAPAGVVTFVDPTCANNNTASATIPVTPNVKYQKDGGDVVGTVNYTPGTSVTIVAVGTNGYSVNPAYSAVHAFPVAKTPQECLPPTDVCANIEGPQSSAPEGTVIVDGNCVPPTDVCANIDGVQTEVPAGTVIVDGNCVPPTDVCANIDGVQTEVPAGTVLVDGNCVPPTDVCANIEGPQSSAPEGTVIVDGNCVPPTDVCSNIDGAQTEVPAGTVQSGSECVPVESSPPTDVCSNIDGIQASVPSGMVLDGSNCVLVESNGPTAPAPEVLPEQLPALPGLLPETGSSSTPLALAAGALIGLGTIALTIAARRRPARV